MFRRNLARCMIVIAAGHRRNLMLFFYRGMSERREMVLIGEGWTAQQEIEVEIDMEVTVNLPKG